MNDLRFAFRQLAKTPGFAIIALLTLALGIGLNSAMFNIVNSIVLQPLRFPDPDNLFRLERVNAQLQPGGHRTAHFVAIARESQDFVQLACSRPWSFTLSEAGRPAEVIASLRASAGYFNVLGVHMTLGREFLPSEDVPGRDQVIILSHAYWLSHFSGDPGIIGKTVRLDGQPNEIIGVAPELANDPRSLNPGEIYRPLALTAEELKGREDHAFDIIGRYRPGITAAQAASRFSAIAASLTESDPKEYKGHSLRTVSLVPELQGTGRQIIFMLIGLSGFVLLIACANLANLLLARAIARSREFAIRGALGASRSQLIRPLIAECAILAGAGGGLGVLVSIWTNDWMADQFRASGSIIDFPLDWRLLLFAFGASLATGLLFGVVPAWVTSRVHVNDALKSGTRGSTGDRSQNRFRQMLIAGQFALALVLLSGAVLFVRGLDQYLHRDAGWNPAPLLRGILSMPMSRYPDTEHMERFYERVQERVSALPGVAAAAISHEVPIYFPSGRRFIVQGQPPPAPGNEPGAPINGVTPGYFNTVGTRLTHGRDFSPADKSDSPHVIIINETMARTLFPGKDAVGQHLAFFDEQPTVWMEVVGVAADVQFLNLTNTSASFQAYLPQSQATWSYVALIVRASGPPATLIESIRRAVAELDPDMAVKELTPVPDFIQRNLQQMTTINHLLVGFAVLGLFLAALGIYGVIARIVAQRTNEIGIRMALGAQVSQIARLILGAGMRMVLIGTAIGLLGAVGLARFLAFAMPGLSGNSVAAIAGATTVLIAVALLACWVPARKATKVDPMVALRTE
jgi:putative ABC transport system permease protein